MPYNSKAELRLAICHRITERPVTGKNGEPATGVAQGGSEVR